MMTRNFLFEAAPLIALGGLLAGIVAVPQVTFADEPKPATAAGAEEAPTEPAGDDEPTEDEKKEAAAAAEAAVKKAAAIQGGKVEIQMGPGGPAIIQGGAVVVPGNAGAVRIEVRPAGQVRGAVRVQQKEEQGEKEGEGEGDGEPGDDDETTEEKIAAFLKKREGEARKPRALKMQHRVEELESIVGLSEEQRRQLEIASKGAIEKSLEPWREQMENYVRQYIQRSPQNVDMVLASIGNVNFGRTPDQQVAEQKIWQSTIERVLDEQQMAEYQAVVDEREDYLFAAVSELMIADLDRSLRFSSEQREQLKDVLMPVVEEYLIYLGRWSSDGNLPIHQLPTLLCGVKDKALKGIINDQQIEGWKGRCANFRNMWQAVQQQKQSVEEAEG